MLRHVALVRTDVSGELSVSMIRVSRIGELGTTLAITSNRQVTTLGLSPCTLKGPSCFCYVNTGSPITVTLMYVSDCDIPCLQFLISGRTLLYTAQKTT
jgi:hypothetical protein